MFWNDAERLVQEVEFAINKLTGSSPKILSIDTPLRGLVLFKDAVSPEFDRDLSSDVPFASSQTAFGEELAKLLLLPSLRLSKLWKPQFRYERVGEAADGSRKAKRIQVDTFLGCSVALPSPAEQQKVAECLSSTDKVIAAQSRKVGALKTYKKGLMQQLFPRDDETQPRLRFPEFRGKGEWVTEALGQLASYENGKAYEKDITENGKYIVVNSRFISTNGAIRKYTNADYLIAKAGEVLMVLSDLPKGRALAKCYFVDADERYAVNQRVCRLKPTRIDGKFLYYVLNRHPRLLAYDDGLNQTHLSKSGVTECPLCVPQEKGEQQRIAGCLSSLDALITAATQKLEALKRHKRGLIQRLFPSQEEAEA